MGAPADTDTIATPVAPTETPAKENTVTEAHIPLGEPETMTERAVILVDNSITKPTFDLPSAILMLRGSVLNEYVNAEMTDLHTRSLQMESKAADYIDRYAEKGEDSPTLEEVEQIVARSLAARYIDRMFYHVMSPISVVADKHDLVPAISEMLALVDVYSADEQDDASAKPNSEEGRADKLSRTDSLKLAIEYLTAVVKDETLEEGVEDANFFTEIEYNDDDDIDTKLIEGESPQLAVLESNPVTTGKVIGQQEQSPVALKPTEEAETSDKVAE